MYGNVEVHLTTNLDAANQYEWWLRDVDGTELGHESHLADNTAYVDTFHLGDGCYEFQLINHEGYGLDWWATKSQLGSGRVWLTRNGVTTRSFSGDFGSEVYMQFIVGPMPTILHSADSLIFTGIPVGGASQLHVRFTPANVAGLNVNSISLGLPRGQFAVDSVTKASWHFPLTLALGDTLDIPVNFTPTSTGGKTARLTINSNDELTSSLSIVLLGNMDPLNAVLNDEAQHPIDLALQVSPSVVTSDAMITLRTAAGSIAQVDLVNSMGKHHCAVIRWQHFERQGASPFSARRFAPGMYFLRLISDHASITAPLIIIH